MANVTVSSLDKMLDRLHLTIAKCLGLADENPVLGLLNKVTSHKPYGRTLYMNMPFKITSGGQFGLGAEAGAIPAGLASTSNEGKITPKKLWAMVMDFTHETEIAMGGGRKKLRTSLEGELSDALETWQKRRVAIFGGQRGDGVLGRVNGATTSSTSITMDEGFTAVPGDTILSYSARDTNSTTGNMISTAVAVTKVDHINNKITVASAQTIADEALLAYSSGVVNQTEAGSRQQWPMGIPGHVDDVDLSTDNWYDTGDGTDYDHVDTYMGLARSSVGKLNSISIDADDNAIDEYYLSLPAAAAVDQGAKRKNLVYYMSPKQWRRVIKYFSGLSQMQRAGNSDITMPGGTMNVPVLYGIGGIGQIPVVCSNYIPDGCILCLSMGDFEQLLITDDWVRQGPSRGLLVPDGSGSYLDIKRYARRAYWETVCRHPYRQAAMYNLDTTN